MVSFLPCSCPPMAYQAKFGNAFPEDETCIHLLRTILMNTIQDPYKGGLPSRETALLAVFSADESPSRANRLGGFVSKEREFT